MAATALAATAAGCSADPAAAPRAQGTASTLTLAEASGRVADLCPDPQQREYADFDMLVCNAQSPSTAFIVWLFDAPETAIQSLCGMEFSYGYQVVRGPNWYVMPNPAGSFPNSDFADRLGGAIESKGEACADQASGR